MNFQFVFKHMDRSPSLQSYAEEKLREKIQKFVTKAIDVHVFFEVIGGDHKIHCSLSGGDGYSTQVEAVSGDMYASVDLLADKLSSQLKKHKEKLKHHKGKANVRSLSDYAKKSKSGSRENGPDYVDAEDILKFEAAKKRQMQS